MATADFLSGLRRPHRTAGCLVISLLAACLSLMPGFAVGAGSSEWLDGLPEADRYRQFNLVLMVSEGVDPAFLGVLESAPFGEPPERAGAHPFPQVDIDAFQTPLNRIVDQQALIDQAAEVFRFAQENRGAITQAMEDLAESHPGQVAEVDLIRLAEDAVIIRTSLTGSFEYLLSQGLWASADPAADAGSAAIPGYLETYRNRTLFLRNVMEYWEFERELAAITDEAMDDTGGRMEAYQRMLEDEPSLDSFRQHLQAVEYIYWQARGRKGKPPELPGDELIEAESRVN